MITFENKSILRDHTFNKAPYLLAVINHGLLLFGFIAILGRFLMSHNSQGLGKYGRAMFTAVQL